MVASSERPSFGRPSDGSRNNTFQGHNNIVFILHEKRSIYHGREISVYSRLGGGGVLALEMGRGVPPVWSKPDPVAIHLIAQKTPCPNFEFNTEFNWVVYGVITNILLHVLMVFLSSIIFVYEMVKLLAVKLENSDGILLIIAWEISNIHAKSGAQSLKLTRHPVQRHIPSTLKYGKVPPPMAPPPPPGFSTTVLFKHCLFEDNSRREFPTYPVLPPAVGSGHLLAHLLGRHYRPALHLWWLSGYKLGDIYMNSCMNIVLFSCSTSSDIAIYLWKNPVYSGKLPRSTQRNLPPDTYR